MVFAVMEDPKGAEFWREKFEGKPKSNEVVSTLLKEAFPDLEEIHPIMGDIVKDVINKDGKGDVTEEDLGLFLKRFGPWSMCLQKAYDALYADGGIAPWWHGDKSFEEAGQELTGKPEGTFLLRLSSKPDAITLVYVHKGKILNLSIKNKGEKGYTYNRKAPKYFKNALEVIKKLKKKELITESVTNVSPFANADEQSQYTGQLEPGNDESEYASMARASNTPDDDFVKFAGKRKAHEPEEDLEVDVGPQLPLKDMKDDEVRAELKTYDFEFAWRGDKIEMIRASLLECREELQKLLGRNNRRLKKELRIARQADTGTRLEILKRVVGKRKLSEHQRLGRCDLYGSDSEPEDDDARGAATRSEPPKSNDEYTSFSSS